MLKYLKIQLTRLNFFCALSLLFNRICKFVNLVWSFIPALK